MKEHTIIQQYENASPEQLLQGIVKQYPAIAFACSMGAEDVVLLDLLHRLNFRGDVFFLDTDFHFQETLELKQRLSERYGSSFLSVKSELTPLEQAEHYGEELWRRDPNTCCDLRKVRPLQIFLRNYDAWITGIRREQSPTRAHAKKIEWDPKFELMKINPLAEWTHEQVWQYILAHQLPYHPLHDQHYPSIGCTHCTRPIQPGEHARAGRWAGLEKTECGLHQ
jgi:phosphoadenosine phosphosulfate reductase